MRSLATRKKKKKKRFIPIIHIMANNVKHKCCCVSQVLTVVHSWNVISWDHNLPVFLNCLCEYWSVQSPEFLSGSLQGIEYEMVQIKLRSRFIFQ